MKVIYSGRFLLKGPRTGRFALHVHLSLFELNKHDILLLWNHSCMLSYICELVMQNDQMRRLGISQVSTCRLTSEGQVHVFGGGRGNFSDVISGSYHIIHAHPEALFSSHGDTILESELKFGAIIIDECHIIEEWYLPVFLWNYLFSHLAPGDCINFNTVTDQDYIWGRALKHIMQGFIKLDSVTDPDSKHGRALNGAKALNEEIL